MEIAEYQNIANNEAHHFYYVAVHELILSLVEGQLKDSDSQILDAGCGTGSLAKKLEKFGEVRAVDIHDEAVRYARHRGVKVTQSSIETIPFEPSSFDLVTSVDVIYHKAVNDDVIALKQFYSVLKPGGSLVVRVPAEPSLHSSHDEVVHTARRYTKTELQKKLKAAGFKIEKITYCQSPLFIPAWVKARLDQGKVHNHNSVIDNQSKWLNELLISILKAENRFIVAGGTLPKGIGLVAVCRKL